MSDRPLRVLVVDDSAFARKVIREVLASDPGIHVVGIARDGLEALEKIAELAPDVVTLDLLMPNLDGLGVLRSLRGKPAPRFVVVGTSDLDSHLAIRALEEGAIDFVHKPTALATDRLYELSTELVAKVKLAAGAKSRHHQAPTVPVSPPLQPRASSPAVPAVRLVVIGTSTGGPQALTRLLTSFPPGFPVPIAVVLHIPVGYTRLLSERLNEAALIDVVEASEGALIRPGLAMIARAGMHMKIVPDVDAVRVHLDVQPLDTPHRPAVDVLFATAARAYGRDVLGVVLTGMGEDGLRGSRAIHEAGGLLLTEAESSCVVYGMPRVVHEAGLGSESVPLDEMAAAIQRRVALSRRD